MESHKGIVLEQVCFPIIWKVVAGVHEFKVILNYLHGGQPGIHETPYEKNKQNSSFSQGKMNCLFTEV